MAKRLIINADDYGRTPGVSAGIRKAHRDGIVTSTTAMMNMPGIEPALHQAMRECPELGLGVHLVVTSGRPLLPACQVPSLTNGGNEFPSLALQKPRLAQIELGQLRAEWLAQVEAFVQITGQRPDHLDSHHHFSYLSPQFFGLMLELAGELHCAVRTIQPLFSPLEQGESSDLTQTWEYLPRLLKSHAIPHPDHFLGTFYDQTSTLEHLTILLNRLPEGSSELMCHPGYADQTLLGEAGSSYNLQREAEINVLTDKRLEQTLARQEITRITFAAL